MGVDPDSCDMYRSLGQITQQQDTWTLRIKKRKAAELHSRATGLGVVHSTDGSNLKGFRLCGRSVVLRHEAYCQWRLCIFPGIAVAIGRYFYSSQEEEGIQPSTLEPPRSISEPLNSLLHRSCYVIALRHAWKFVP